MIARQDGYLFQANTNAQVSAAFGASREGEPNPHFLIQHRAAELNLATECVSTLAASEISAVIRLPNSVNRTAGQVRQFAQQHHSPNTTTHKRMEAFRRIQGAITKAVPEDFFEFLETAQEGIRLISDAHLEWIKLRGLPLSIQKDVSRIAVTPGNLFVDQIVPKTYLHLKQEDFYDILVLSALDEADPISPFLDTAVEAFAPALVGKLRVQTKRIRTQIDFIDALNSFGGALMIFDGHGEHRQGQAGKLRLLEETINIWDLRSNRPRVPPIVVLSACDTHAADRNHASTANGFLAIGARAVLGSVFPINALDAATFIARLLYRIAVYVPLARQQFGRSLTWLEVMSGMIRMQLLTDYCKRMEKRELINRDSYFAIHAAGNAAINSTQIWPFESIVDLVVEKGVDESLARRELFASTANSTAISYLHMGRPETIVVH